MQTKIEVVPAILAGSEREFRERLRRIERHAPLVHIDVMDGRFVPNRTWANPSVVARVKTPVKFEVHLMVSEPFRRVVSWGRVKNVKRLIVHAESTKKLGALLRAVRTTEKGAGLAVNPRTPIRNLYPFLERTGLPRTRAARARNDEKGGDVDFVLVMANEPGSSGRSFRRATLKRISALRKRYPILPIGVDIGVSTETAPLLVSAGATHVAAASAIFGQPNPVVAFRALKRAFGA